MSTARGADPFAETEDQTALRELAREVGRRAVAPHAGEADATGELSKVALQALADADLFRVTIGEQWGGLGLGDVEAAIVLEEIARHDISTAICCQLAFNGPSRGIEHLGGEALKDRWLPQVADGEAIVSIGITEPDAGSAVQNMRSALVADGDGRWRLNGYKNYSTLGHVAKGILVWCRWPGGSGSKGIGAVVVPMDRDGVEVTGRHQGMGIHAATEAEVAFDGVAIGEDDILIAGDPGTTAAFKVLLGHLNHERCGNAAMCTGAAQGALEHAVRYMNDREVDGRPIADLQGLRWKLADMATQLEGARLLLDPGRPPGRARRHPAAAGDRPGQDGRQPGRQVRLRRGHADPRRLRLQPRVPPGACLPGHPGAVLRGGDGGGPEELHRRGGGRRQVDGVAGLGRAAGRLTADMARRCPGIGRGGSAVRQERGTRRRSRPRRRARNAPPTPRPATGSSKVAGASGVEVPGLHPLNRSSATVLALNDGVEAPVRMLP